MEYLVIRFPHPRRVIINENFQGRTNELIELEGGKYTVSLEPVSPFRPDSQAIDLRNTSALAPMTIRFEED